MRIDITTIRNFKGLHVSVKTLFQIISITDERGEFRFRPGDLAKSIGASERTVRSYLKTFCECNVLKFKYNGAGRINPAFYYTGAASEIKKSMEEYSAFKSDF